MRFRSLTLEAFGPFTKERLDLSGGAPGGLHVVYGPNEAGKSTSLRAVTGLLFGIPERTVDAHLHPTKSLSLAAVLERNGDVLEFVRRKRRKDSLVDAEGKPLPDGALGPWLCSLDERSFVTRFGLDQERLEEGAEALLGGSEEGLFAAGTAGTDVRRLLDELDRQASDLYLPRGSKPRLNRALVQLSEASKAARLAVRPPERWREQVRAFEQAKQRVSTLEAERRRLRSEQGRLGRLASVLSDVSRWVDATAERRGLGALPELPPDASERRELAERQAREAELEVARLSRESEDVARALAALPRQSSLANIEEERLSALEKKIGWEFKAREDLPKLRARLGASLEETRRLLEALGHDAGSAPLERADALRVAPTLERQVRRLAAEHGKLSVAAEQGDRLVHEVRRELDQVKGLLGAEPEPEGLEHLERALGAARHVQAERGRRDTLERERLRVRARVVALQGELRVELTLSTLTQCLPPLREVERARADYVARRSEVRRIAEQRAAEETRIVEAEARIVALEAAGEVPTEVRLAEARRARDEVLERLVQVAENPDAVRSAARELSAREQESDRVADRLRTEAHRVSVLQGLEESRRVALAHVARLEGEAAEVEKRLAELEVHWRGRWAPLGLAEVSLEDALELRQRLQDLAERLEQLEVIGGELAALEEQAERARSVLARALASVGVAQSEQNVSVEGVWAALGALQAVAEQKHADLRDVRERRRAATQRARELEGTLKLRSLELADAKRALGAWREAWENVAPRLGLLATTPPDEALAVLTELSTLARLADDARDKERRVRGIERDSAEFSKEVRALAERHAPDLREREASEAAEELLLRVRSARDTERERKRLEAEHHEKREHTAVARANLDSATAGLSALMRTAGVTDAGQLPQVEAATRRGRELDAQIAVLEDALRSKAGSGSLRDLIEEAQSTRHDELLAQQDDVERRIEELEEELRDAQHEMLTIERGLDLYRGEEAAQALQSVEAATAEARESVREFLRVRAARILLQREVTRYAERHQGPILARASEHFPRLTLDRYSGLRVGLGERTLHCVREGRELEVGELSRGTRAQLYLALRLASLEHHFDHHPAVPLVFDDLFVDFDDDRAAAAFELLGELARRVQILYFTHLGRDLQAARDAVPRGLLFEHRIGVDGVLSTSAG